MSARTIDGVRGRDAQRWQGPAVASQDDGQRTKAPAAPLTIDQLEAVQQQAWDEGWAQGHTEGLDAGKTEIAAMVGRLDGIMQAFAQPFDDLDACVEEQVVALATVVVRHLLRRELKTDPAHVIGVVREALGALPVAAQNVRLVLHPDDAELVRSVLGAADGEPAWQIFEDPVMTRGGCRVDSDTSHVDARVESRLSAILSAIGGDERRRNDDPDTGRA